MKKLIATVLIMATILITLCACTPTQQVDENYVVYSSDDVVNGNFGGLGVEWGVYEDTNKLADNARQRITSAADRLNPSVVRCMTNLDWIVTDFDNHGTEDVADDTWAYNFDNKYMASACEILDYCQIHDVEVAFGVWNVLGKADNSDGIGMVLNATSDIRWAKMVADLMEYLVKFKGYDCIKWFVNTNEPNYAGLVGSSKNAYNTYEKWQQGVINVRNALDGVGLTNLDIVGGDVTFTTNESAQEYLKNIANNLADVVHNYGVHLYVNDLYIINGTFQKQIEQNYATIQKIDSSLGNGKKMYIWEAGLLDGKNTETDCNSFIANYSYGLRMADFTVQSVLAGVNGIAFWDFDDAMHFMYTENGMTAKEWGMFSTLNDASALRQEYRPWFHSTVLLSNLMTRGSVIYKGTYSENDKFRTLAVTSQDHERAGFVAVNRDTQPITKTFCLQQPVNNVQGKLYVYVFNEKSLCLDEDGFVTYNAVIDGSINDQITLEVPANSVVIVSNVAL